MLPSYLHKHTFHTYKTAADYAHSVALLEVQLGRVEIGNLLILVTRNPYKTGHLVIRHYYWSPKAIHLMQHSVEHEQPTGNKMVAFLLHPHKYIAGQHTSLNPHKAAVTITLTDFLRGHKTLNVKKSLYILAQRKLLAERASIDKPIEHQSRRKISRVYTLSATSSKTLS